MVCLIPEICQRVQNSLCHHVPCRPEKVFHSGREILLGGLNICLGTPNPVSRNQENIVLHNIYLLSSYDGFGTLLIKKCKSFKLLLRDDKMRYLSESVYYTFFSVWDSSCLASPLVLLILMSN